ncbi:hypothetical protein [Salinispira pacifica]
MKKVKRAAVAASVLFLLSTALLGADPVKHINLYADDPDVATYRSSIDGVLADDLGRPVGQLTVGELVRLANEVSVSRQQYEWVKRSQRASAVLPGVGQYMNGDSLSGTLFLGGDILLFAGTIVGAYFLLPEDLRFSSISYFGDSSQKIHDAWNSHSFSDFLPTIGVLAGGFILQGVLRVVSANHAAGLARENIREGRISFEPEPLFFSDKSGTFGFGVGGHVRY